MLRFSNRAYILIAIALCITLTACTTADIDKQSESEANETIPTEAAVQPEFTLENFEDYMKYAKSVQHFEPYYQLVFDYAVLPEGVVGVPIDDVLAMYQELKTTFDYIAVMSQNPLLYIGIYEGDVDFVDSYDEYQSTYAAMGQPSPINYVGSDRDGNEMISTPLKTVILCENASARLSSYIAEGRNLALSDFTLSSQDALIPVVLGSAYQGIFALGDTFSLLYFSVEMNFEVVGFYQSGLEFSMATGATQKVDIDHSIVLPFFIPGYEAVGEDAIFQHCAHVAELTSGYIAIEEPIADIQEETYEVYLSIVREIEERHGLSDTHVFPIWPVGFVFPSSNP